MMANNNATPIGGKKLLPVNPRTKANFLSKLFFYWLTPFIRLGNTRELQVEDLYQVLPDDESERLGLRLQKEWERELNEAKQFETVHGDGKTKKIQPSLTRAMRRTFGLKSALLSLISLTEECGMRILQPLLLSRLIRYFDSSSGMSATEAYLYATGVILCSASYGLTKYGYFYVTRHLGMQMRVAFCSLMYKKSLLLSHRALGKQTSIGQVVNLMSNDVNRFDRGAKYFNYLWISPLQALITTTILYFVIGKSCFVGLLTMLLYVPLQGWVAKEFSKLRLKTAARTDERIRTMNEIVTGIRVIKMYTWEKPFATLIHLCRKMEVNVIRRTAYFRALNNSLCHTSSKLIVFLTFVVYGLIGNHLTPEKVFLAVAMFNNFRIGMTNYFPNAVTSAAEARASLKRIEEFLLLDEMPKKRNQTTKGKKSLVELDRVTAKWPSATEGNTLSNVSFTVRPGQVMAVVGQVGSGKSTLLNVILGELPLLSGNCRVQGKVAYAPQDAWIFSGTIRENILCGSQYNEQRYRQVVEAAALGRDLTLLPKGDQSVMGERGISLSGGQKARVNLARCLYVDADVYLMDDPLSAVDTHVGRHLFDKAINGFLRDKIRILVTHQLQYLKDVDKILVLKEWKHLEIRNPAALMASGHIDNHLSSAIDEGETTAKAHPATQSNADDVPDELTNEESRQSGGVTTKTYWKYLRSGGRIISLFFLLCFFLMAQMCFTGIDYWLSIWTNAEFIRYHTNKPVLGIDASEVLVEQAQNNTFTYKSWKEEVDTYTGIYVYSVFIGGVFVFAMVRSTHFFVTCMFASVKLHDDMFTSIVRAPLSFFDKTPIGRVLNRFIKDIGCMDDQLPDTFFELCSAILDILGVLVLVMVMNWWLTLPAILLIGCFFLIRRMYLVTSLNLRRLEGTTRSPVFTHLSSSLAGLTTLRAHQCETIFQQTFDARQDIHSSAFYLSLATARWFSILLDWTLITYLACVTYGVVALGNKLNGSEAGLIMSSLMFMTTIVNYGVLMLAEVENLMTSTERVIEYGNLPSEASLVSLEDRKPTPQWPSEGNVRFEDMSLSYSDSSPVLKNITCNIRSREKIGIVGRTGAGKSSLIAALFRLTEPDGKIIIDGIDTKSIGLHDLRSKISIIPQDPVLFTGTLRKNLDPFGQFNDDVLWNALEDVQLKESMAADVQLGLDFLVAEGGSNLSVGQRQLVCLARTIFRENRILVLDEATANVDLTTDRLIQMTIREKFNDCTVLTIAHRLDTIMDSDKVMVLDAGYLMEFDSPSNLLKNKESRFYQLVEQTGKQQAAELTKLTKDSTINTNYQSNVK